MKNILPNVSFVFLGILCFCQPKKDNGPASDNYAAFPAPFKLNLDAIANVIIERSKLQNGERVLLIAKPGEFDSLVYVLKNKIPSVNAEFLGAISVTHDTPEGWSTEFSRACSGKSRDQLVQRFKSVDLGIMLPGADTTHAPYAAMQTVLKYGSSRTIHFHWAGAYRMDGSVLKRSQMVDELYQTALLFTEYKKLTEHQKEFEIAARKGPIRITSPLGTDIQFLIGDRPVTKQDGDASGSRSKRALNLIDREIELPAGAVRVAPIEKTVEGEIAFPDMMWGDVRVTGLVMKFVGGKAINIQATSGLDHVKKELQKSGHGASSFRELAVGLNPLLAVPQVGIQWIPYYGYGAGIVRLSLGDNSELGGEVRGGYVRWNFFTDATVQIGDEIWIQDGRLIHTPR